MADVKASNKKGLAQDTEKKSVAAKAKVPSASSKAVAKEKKTSDAQFTVRQIASSHGRSVKQQRTLIGLGLGKISKESRLEDTPATRGMVARVKHLVEIVE
jgi:large subunit ribosomal protein L30